MILVTTAPYIRLACLAACVWLVAAHPESAGAVESTEFFETRIRPILVAHCYECHSTHGKSEGKLVLDHRDALRRGGESGPVVVPGDPAKSRLLAALKYDGLEMPPAGKLPEAVIADFARWIQDGANDPRDTPPAPADVAEATWKAQLAERRSWWSLQPPRDSPPPELPAADKPGTIDSTWAREPVDRFLLTALRSAGLEPSRPADADTLARRLSFILTGLPPSLQQVRDFRAPFAADPDSALARYVDELLESPHFGERFARHWMDVVRYTDTFGYEWDNPAKGSWEYRDYLIRAFNADVGFDQLVREQLAGDLLTNPRIHVEDGVNESLIGPMFYHMGEHRHGTSLDFNGIHQEMTDNKIDAFSKAFLGLTAACARCHDHKLDAISQRDYYALAGVFMTPRWTPRDISLPAANAEVLDELKRLREAIRGELAKAWTAPEATSLTAASLKNWADSQRSKLTAAKLDEIGHPLAQLLRQPVWLKVEPLAATAESPVTKLTVDGEGAWLASGEVPPTDTYTIRFRTGAGTARLMRLEVLPHASLGGGGPGRTPHGNFVLTHFRVEVKPNGDPAAKETTPLAATPVPLASATADFSQANYPVEAALDPSPSTGWGVGGVTPINVHRTAKFVFAQPVDLPHGGEWTVTLEHRYGSQHVLGRFRLTPGAETNAPLTPDEQAAADRAIVERWKQLVSDWSAQRQARQQANAAFTVLADFSSPSLPVGWSIDGRGLATGYVTDGAPLVALQGDSLVHSLLPRGYHTHALSSKLAGAIRLSRPETWPRKMVSLRMAGGDWAGRIDIPQNAFQAEGVSFFDPAAAPVWQAVARSPLNNGVTRVLTEFSTASLNPNFPPRTGLARSGATVLPDEDLGRDKRSWFSVTRIVAHDAPGAPAESLDGFAPLYESPTPSSTDEAWQRIADWLAGSVRRWSERTASDADLVVVNWLLAQQLLPNARDRLPQVAALVDQYRQVEARLPFARSAMSMDESGVEPVDYRLNIRGDVHSEGAAVRRGFLEVFSGQHRMLESPGSGRLELAEYLASRHSPQTARVYVNRVWQWVFGAGLVATPNDFGKLGERPSHPELLDWLALRFMEEGWSTKRLVRRLVLSCAFRQSGVVSPAAADRDPDNRLLHHYATRRLEAEEVRDSLLFVSGRLNPRLYGPPINPPRVAEDAKKRLYSGPWDTDGRRSLYITMSIMEPPKFLVVFNLPDLKLPTGRRDQTNVPAQALTLLNDPVVTRLADHWAQQLLQDGLSSPEERVGGMLRSAFAREPKAEEIARWSAAVRTFAPADQDVMRCEAAWSAVAHALFNAKEFLYIR